MNPHPFPPEEFRTRRERLMQRLDGTRALVQGAGPVQRSEAFRQTNEMHYLCGIETPQAYLLMDPRGSTLFLPHRDARVERSEGPGHYAEDTDAVCGLTGVDHVRPLEELPFYLIHARELYTPFAPAEGPAAYRDELVWAAARTAADPWDGAVAREARLAARLREQFPLLQLHDLSPHLDELRLIKSPLEVARLRRAGELTALGVREAMRASRPGLYEYQLGAVAEAIHRVGGAGGEGYRAIIGSGHRIWYAHYNRNNARLEPGDLVLMDYAPDFFNYTSDIGRTWPISGQFSPVQRELYEFITTYHRTVLRLLRPGPTPAQILEEAAREMAPVVESTGFSQPHYREAAHRTLSFTGHLSHPVGMAVHDVGSYWNRPLEPGLVISIDPQMWIPEKQLYVRVEDTIVITEDGMENFTALAPLKLADIEAAVGTSSLLLDLIQLSTPNL